MSTARERGPWVASGRDIALVAVLILAVVLGSVAAAYPGYFWSATDDQRARWGVAAGVAQVWGVLLAVPGLAIIIWEQTRLLREARRRSDIRIGFETPEQPNGTYETRDVEKTFTAIATSDSAYPVHPYQIHFRVTICNYSEKSATLVTWNFDFPTTVELVQDNKTEELGMKYMRDKDHVRFYVQGRYLHRHDVYAPEFDVRIPADLPILDGLPTIDVEIRGWMADAPPVRQALRVQVEGMSAPAYGGLQDSGHSIRGL